MTKTSSHLYIEELTVPFVAVKIEDNLITTKVFKPGEIVAITTNLPTKLGQPTIARVNGWKIFSCNDSFNTERMSSGKPGHIIIRKFYTNDIYELATKVYEEVIEFDKDYDLNTFVNFLTDLLFEQAELFENQEVHLFIGIDV